MEVNLEDFGNLNKDVKKNFLQTFLDRLKRLDLKRKPQLTKKAKRRFPLDNIKDREFWFVPGKEDDLVPEVFIVTGVTAGGEVAMSRKGSKDGGQISYDNFIDLILNKALDPIA